MSVRSRSNWNLKVLVFVERGNRSTGRKTSRSKGEKQQQTQQHMASTPGFEPGPHWWEESALNTAPPLLPKGTKKNYVESTTNQRSEL